MIHEESINCRNKFVSESILTIAGSFCKYYPTCSQYAKEAIQKYGSLKGTSMAMKRILRCNPFSKGGYDPVP